MTCIKVHELIYSSPGIRGSLKNASGIQQLTFRIFPRNPDEDLIWEVPNRAKLLGKGVFKIHILKCVEVTMYWPTDPKRRIVHGKFVGSLPTRLNKPMNPVCRTIRTHASRVLELDD
jgi:hypothetical protein